MEKTVISSRTNELVKKLKKLREKKYREFYGEYIAEGKRWVSDALTVCPQNVSAVIRSNAFDCERADFVLSDELYGELTQTENGQGIMAVMRIPEPKELSAEYCLFLDRVRDPGNMGTIIRTAVAAGYNDIMLHDCVDVYNPKVIRSSMTGVLGVNFVYAEDLSVPKSKGYKTIAAELSGTDVFGYGNRANKTCLVIGNEADGISDSVLSECDDTVTIPMQSGMESLNAAVSAGILMYELKYKKENF